MSTILIADDEARIRRLVSDFLKRDGHTIVEAADGKEALNILENRRPGLDMAILDVMMPGMDGFEVLRELREQEHGETHLPVMLLTARAEDADQVRGLEGGADDYVTKPFSPIVLAARVRTLLKREGRVGAPLEQLGKLSVNELRREVMVENKPIDLTPRSTSCSSTSKITARLRCRAKASSMLSGVTTTSATYVLWIRTSKSCAPSSGSAAP